MYHASRVNATNPRSQDCAMRTWMKKQEASENGGVARIPAGAEEEK
jgi:hypothetical protein